MEEILEALAAEAGGGGKSAKWANKTASIMGKMSPTSMKVTLRMLREHASMPLDEVLKVEYRYVTLRAVGRGPRVGLRRVLKVELQKPFIFKLRQKVRVVGL